MKVLEIPELLYENDKTILKIQQEGIVFNISDKEIFIEKQTLKNISIYHSICDYCLRIITYENVYDIINLHESWIIQLRSIIQEMFNIMVEISDLEIYDTTHGNLVYSNSIIQFCGKKELFSIPKSKILKVTELENEIEFHLPKIEIVFNSTSNILQYMGNEKCEELCILNNINCIYPRSKMTIVFYDEYFIAKGSSYDHNVMYDSIEEVFFLKRDSYHYLVLKLGEIVMQGQTKYESLVFLLTDNEIEVATKNNGKLKSFYKGGQDIVVLEIIETLIKISAQESNKSIKCTNKINTGHLYLMEESIQFLPKLISINLNEISNVEFLRINLSFTQAKTFDMIIYANNSYTFNGISKEFFNILEVFFTDNKIRIISEVIDESFSENSNEEESGSNISDLVRSEDE